MLPAAKRGPHTNALSPPNGRSMPVIRKLRDEVLYWVAVVPGLGGGGHLLRDWDHRRSAGVDGLDDLDIVDTLEEIEVTPTLLWPSWRWMTVSGTPSWAISTAWACLSWCGAKRRRTPAAGAPQLGACRGGRPVPSARR